MSTENDNKKKNNLLISDVRKRYSSVIADIYEEHHVSMFDDNVKHNEGIIKAMAEFAIFYKEQEK